MKMNNSRTFWISLACAVFSMFLIYSFSQEQKAKYDKRYGTTKTVLAAAKDILEMQHHRRNHGHSRRKARGFHSARRHRQP